MLKISYPIDDCDLCRQILTVYLDSKKYDFGCCLYSGGDWYIDDDCNAVVTEAPWELNEKLIPDDFPKDKIKDVLDLVNEQVPQGCCGGCI